MLNLNSMHKGQAVIESIFTIMLFVMLMTVMGGFCTFLFIQFNLVTAAREGARSAAVNSNLVGANSASAISTAQTTVINFFKTATGQTLQTGQITITGPAGATMGQRVVTAKVDFTFKSPINIAGFLGAPNWSNIPMSATASMRYEE